MDESTADDLRDERKFRQHMDSLGAKQIGAALYEDTWVLQQEIKNASAKLEAMQRHYKHLTGKRFCW